MVADSSKGVVRITGRTTAGTTRATPRTARATTERRKPLALRGQIFLDTGAQLGQGQISALINVPRLEKLGKACSELGPSYRGILVFVENLEKGSSFDDLDVDLKLWWLNRY